MHENLSFDLLKQEQLKSQGVMHIGKQTLLLKSESL
jgi:hypothetical protein